MSTKKFVLRLDASITAGELAVMLQQLGALPTYVDVPDSQTVPEGLKRFFVPVNTTDDQLSELRAYHEGTEQRIRDLEQQLALLSQPVQTEPATQSPAYSGPLPPAVGVAGAATPLEQTLAAIRAKGEAAARKIQGS